MYCVGEPFDNSGYVCLRINEGLYTHAYKQFCQVAISVARFDQTWLYCDPPGYFISFLATGKILAISWLFG